jgi:hypothetical protein
MSTSALRQQVKKQIDALSPQRLRTAADFLAYLEQRQAGGALPKSASQSSSADRFRKRLKKAEDRVAAGKVVAIEKLRRKY